jgi:hypothetical protein
MTARLHFTRRYKVMVFVGRFTMRAFLTPHGLSIVRAIDELFNLALAITQKTFLHFVDKTTVHYLHGVHLTKNSQ